MAKPSQSEGWPSRPCIFTGSISSRDRLCSGCRARYVIRVDSGTPCTYRTLVSFGFESVGKERRKARFASTNTKQRHPCPTSSYKPLSSLVTCNVSFVRNSSFASSSAAVGTNHASLLSITECSSSYPSHRCVLFTSSRLWYASVEPLACTYLGQDRAGTRG